MLRFELRVDASIDFDVKEDATMVRITIISSEDTIHIPNDKMLELLDYLHARLRRMLNKKTDGEQRIDL